jgi:two-component system, cell cycle response regulator DivK
MSQPDPVSILVVDDSPDAREMLAEYLTFRGFAVSEATHGAEAIEIARRVKPRIVLMDLSMPGMDGWEATRQLKADPAMKDVIVIAVSAHAFTNERARAEDAGCDAFVVKPFDLTTLADALDRVVKIGRTAIDFERVGFTRKPPKSRRGS